MSFTSVTFLFIFLPLILSLHWLSPRTFQNTLLLTASLLFYSWGEGFYLSILAASIAFNYGIALLMGERQRRRKIWFAVGIVSNLALLMFFKYAALLVSSLNTALTAAHLPAFPVPDVHLPLGVSFFTFEVMSYLFGVLRGIHPPEKNPVRFALFVSLFPHLIAGPIIRYESLAGQFARVDPDREEAAAGLKRFVIGLGKKVLIADSLARVADPIFALPVESLDSPRVWLAVLCFALQIYYDFSGYSDMAIGLSRVFGFRIPENFNHPYFAASIREFWQRWHISLSTWFRDYLYIPLGGSRRGTARTVLNLFVVFFLCGLWHGASWTFAAWGVFHGCFIGIERLAGGRNPDPPKKSWIGRIYTLVVLSFSWALFRAQDMTQALSYWKLMAWPVVAASKEHHLLIHPETVLVFGAAVLLCVPPDRWRRLVFKGNAPNHGAQIMRGFGPLAGALRTSGYMALLIVSLASAAAYVHQPFIYFRF